MRGIEVEAEIGVMIDGFQGAVSGDDIVSDLSGVYFQSKFNILPPGTRP
jgi:hypothetical protein